MTKAKFRMALGATILSTTSLTAVPAWADLPVTDPISDGIFQTMQNALQSAITSVGKQLQQAMTDITNPTSLASILTNGFNQNSNYAKAQVGAQQEITDASNEAMAQFELQKRDADIRDQQSLNSQQCVGADDGQVIVVAGGQGWKAAQSIEAVTDARGEALQGTPAYFGLVRHPKQTRNCTCRGIATPRTYRPGSAAGPPRCRTLTSMPTASSEMTISVTSTE